MANLDTDSSGKGLKPWAVGIAAIGLIIVVIAVVVTLVTSNSSDDEDSATPEPATSPSLLEEEPLSDVDASDKGWNAAIADSFGREVKVPANGVGNALGKAKNIPETQCDVKSGAAVTIQRTSGTQTIWSNDLGPSEVTAGGAPVGYARSAEAAMMSASNDLVLLYSGGTISADIARHGLSVPDQDSLVEELENSTVKDTTLEDRPAPSAFRITSCEDTRVIGDVAIPLPTDEEGNPTSSNWAVLRMSSVWKEGDWKTELGMVPQPVEDRVTDLEGWTQWQY